MLLSSIRSSRVSSEGHPKESVRMVRGLQSGGWEKGSKRGSLCVFRSLSKGSEYTGISVMCMAWLHSGVVEGLAIEDHRRAPDPSCFESVDSHRKVCQIVFICWESEIWSLGGSLALKNRG